MENTINTIVKNVLTQNEIDSIYAEIGLKEEVDFDLFGQKIVDFSLSDSAKDKIVVAARNSFGIDDLYISEYQFARYVKADNGDVRPILFPHADRFAEQRYTFDYQIGGNFRWPLIVEGQEFTLDNNQALTFSGTHQVHWRTNIEFSVGQYLDMVFFHLRRKSDEPINEDFRESIKRRAESMRPEFYGE